MASKEDARMMDFMMGFISNSKRYKDQFTDRWREVLANFIVTPEDYATSTTSRPYDRGQRPVHMGSGIVLKDAETHKAIMTYAANLTLTILGDRRGEYVRAKPVGYEDAVGKAPTVTKLLRYAFGQPGIFRSMTEAIVDMLLFGTAVVEIPWKFQERDQLVRSIQDIGGIIQDEFTRQRVVTYDDVDIKVVDVQKFYPDPSEYRIENMSGAAKQFEVNAMQARAMVKAGIWRNDGVERAIVNSSKAGSDRTSTTDEMFREGLDQPYDMKEFGDFTPMIGFEYWGEVPWETEQESSRRVGTLLNGEVVRDIDYPLADSDLPWKTLIINPVCGRFYGISPAEVIRWDQSLQDAIKILMAEAVIRAVHPPLVYDPNSEIDPNALRRFQPDIPLAAIGGPSAVGTLHYDANVFNAFNQTQALKTSMQEASGALSVVQGQGLGVNRASASEAVFTAERALSRPEFAALLLERDGMPGIAKSIIRRYQQFLDDDTELQLRVGEMPEPVWIGDIMGDFDVEFVGSRLAVSRQEKLQSYDRLAGLTAAVPAAQLQVPWDAFLQNLIGDVMELPEVAVQVGTPETMQKNAVLAQVAGQIGPGGGNGNGTTPSSQQAGLPTSQAAGNQLGA